jgi:hypothetical protein
MMVCPQVACTVGSNNNGVSKYARFRIQICRLIFPANLSRLAQAQVGVAKKMVGSGGWNLL